MARWSLGALVVGSAILDATVFSKEPTREQVNVASDEYEQAMKAKLAELGPRDPGLAATRDRRADETIDELLLSGAEPGPGFMYLPASAPRPANRIHADGLTYRLFHATGAGAAIEIEAGDGPCVPTGYIDLDGIDLDTLPLRGYFPDGTYELRTRCAAGGATVTRLVVEPSAPSR